MKSLDESDAKINELWIQEAEALPKEYRARKLEVVAFEDIPEKITTHIKSE